MKRSLITTIYNQYKSSYPKNADPDSGGKRDDVVDLDVGMILLRDAGSHQKTPMRANSLRP